LCAWFNFFRVVVALQIRRHLKEANLPITVPGVVEDLVSGKVLVMRFIDGTKLNDTVLLNRPGFDQKALVKSVCEGIAYQLCVKELSVFSATVPCFWNLLGCLQC
jgi:predicted unusual protein kinase regulating ubiquinone biosynthesis (AarF/ABC1/UbiB family)